MVIFELDEKSKNQDVRIFLSKTSKNDFFHPKWKSFSQHLQTSADDGSTLNYVISGAGAFASQSAAHASDVPRDSSKFYHPHGTFFGQIFPVGSLGWTSGGFVYCRVNKTRAGFGYVDGDVGLSPLLTSMVLEHVLNSIGNIIDIFASQTGKAYSTIIQH
uniref:Uncharacterized protein n=1 Tax=Romanomermis culicivorax TaxID=13658 RepID=A0A915KBB9_ROMCU